MTGQVAEIHPQADESDDEPEIIRAKWTMDEAVTLAEAAAKLREFADELDRLHGEGWTLQEPIADDYGFLVPPAKKG